MDALRSTLQSIVTDAQNAGVAKEFAKQNFPCVILERDESSGKLEWREILRFDWHWDEEAGEPRIGFF